MPGAVGCGATSIGTPPEDARDSVRLYVSSNTAALSADDYETWVRVLPTKSPLLKGALSFAFVSTCVLRQTSPYNPPLMISASTPRIMLRLRRSIWTCGFMTFVPICSNFANERIHD